MLHLPSIREVWYIRTRIYSLLSATYGTVTSYCPRRILNPLARVTAPMISASQRQIEEKNQERIQNVIPSFLSLIEPIGFVISVGGLDTSQVTVCVVLTVHTVQALGLVIGGSYTSRGIWMGVARTDVTRAQSMVMGSVNFMMKSLN